MDQKVLDAFVGDPVNGNGPSNGKDNPNPFDDTTGDPPGIPTNPKGGTSQQGGAGENTSSPGGLNDPTSPEGGCEGDYDFWRPNPEEYKDFVSISSINFNETAYVSEMDLLLECMSVDSMGM